MSGRGITQIEQVVLAKALTMGGAINKIIEINDLVGEAWYALHLFFNYALVHSAGSGVLTDGLTLPIKSILLRTGDGENIVENMPGRSMDVFAQIQSKTALQKTTLAAATATYTVHLPIYFSDPLADVPDDFLLDTSIYTQMQLDIVMGGISDMLSTVGGDTVTCTLDVFVERYMGVIDLAAAPIVYRQYGLLPPVDPTVQAYIRLLRAGDLTYKRLLIGASDSGTVAGPFSGAPGDTVINQLTVQDNYQFPFRAMPVSPNLVSLNKMWYQLEAALVGKYLIDFAESIHGAYYTGNKSRCDLLWTNGAGASAGDQVSCAYDSFRPLMQYQRGVHKTQVAGAPAGVRKVAKTVSAGVPR